MPGVMDVFFGGEPTAPVPLRITRFEVPSIVAMFLTDDLSEALVHFRAKIEQGRWKGRRKRANAYRRWWRAWERR